MIITSNKKIKSLVTLLISIRYCFHRYQTRKERSFKNVTVLNFQPGLEESSWDPRFDHNTVRDTGYDCYPGNGIRQKNGIGKESDIKESNDGS